MTTYLLDKKDLYMIVCNAKKNMLDFNLPIYVTQNQVEQGEIPSLAMLESVLMTLNSKGLLNRIVKVDYTDPACEHDPESPLEDEEPVKKK